ncbi:CinA family protein [Dermatobacter hominis]|uniref:CinA family protein n=1 Tax=Dermatobacter hominis TaxID=2884263 RepID=UPI001D114809|nr:CinA family protein [Dermatobacter hominis]UDY37461.1 CinA family protein [Dermatobacter hominis]
MEPAGPDRSLTTLAELAAQRLQGRTLACAESFTAGLLCQAMASVESSSDWFRGGLVSYQSRVKHEVLGVRPGPVVAEAAARDMAVGVARLLDADIAVATTGVAGPTEQDGRPPGEVVIGWMVDGHVGAETLHIPGDPETVIERGARAAIVRLTAALSGEEAARPLSDQL